MNIEEIGAHLATVRPNGSFDCAYRNAYAQVLLPDARLVFGKFLLNLGLRRVVMSMHVWLELSGEVVDFSWMTFPRQFDDWPGPVVNVLVGPLIVDNLYAYVEADIGTAQFDPIIKEANLDAHDYQGDCRPAVRGAARTAPTLPSVGARVFQHRPRRT